MRSVYSSQQKYSGLSKGSDKRIQSTDKKLLVDQWGLRLYGCKYQTYITKSVFYGNQIRIVSGLSVVFLHDWAWRYPRWNQKDRLHRLNWAADPSIYRKKPQDIYCEWGSLFLKWDRQNLLYEEWNNYKTHNVSPLEWSYGCGFSMHPCDVMFNIKIAGSNPSKAWHIHLLQPQGYFLNPLKITLTSRFR